jgi:ankyrin repeat protein
MLKVRICLKLSVVVRLSCNPLDTSGRTALKMAAIKGHLEIVKALLASKANVNAEGKPSP